MDRDDGQRWRKDHAGCGDGSPCRTPGAARTPVLRFDDALLTEEAMDVVVGLDQRWPEPRALHQTNVFFLEDRGRLLLWRLTAAEAARLLDLVLSLTRALHERAVCDEQATASSASWWVLTEFGVPRAEDLDPSLWLESTDLVRWLRARAGR